MLLLSLLLLSLSLLLLLFVYVVVVVGTGVVWWGGVLTLYYLAGFVMPVCADTPVNQNDELALLDEDDSVDPEDEIRGMEIPDGFGVQASKPAALDSSLLQRGVFVRLGMGWFGGLIIRQSQERTRHLYDYRVQLQEDQSTRSMKLPLEKYSGDPDAVVGSWVLLQRNVAEQGEATVATPRVSRSGRTITPNVTLVDQAG